MVSSTYKLNIDPESGVVAADTDLLVSPIVIIPGQANPGGAAALRVYFTLVGAGDAEITVFRGKVDPPVTPVSVGKFNADNGFIIVSDGIYRFDISIETGDIINFQSNIETTSIKEFRAHLIPFGA